MRFATVKVWINVDIVHRNTRKLSLDAHIMRFTIARSVISVDIMHTFQFKPMQNGHTLAFGIKHNVRMIIYSLTAYLSPNQQKLDIMRCSIVRPHLCAAGPYLRSTVLRVRRWNTPIRRVPLL